MVFWGFFEFPDGFLELKLQFSRSPSDLESFDTHKARTQKKNFCAPEVAPSEL